MQPILIIAVLLFSVVVHEVAHAWQARREGDDTADKLGRITLNPIPHLDFMGSLVVPLILHFSGSGFLFGWAKPVPVNPSKYRSPVWGDIRVSMAGMVPNLILAALATLAAAVVVKTASIVGSVGPVTGVLLQMADYGIVINLILAFFNLVPIPPLDGSHVVAHMLPRSLAIRYQEAGRYGLPILMGLFFLVPGFFQYILWPVTYLRGMADLFIRLWI
jgi:Zn-dependent protease